MRVQKQASLLTTFLNLGDVKHGQMVKYLDKYIIRVKPTQFLLNSTLVGDVLNRGDCFVVNAETGTLYIMQKNTEVSLVDASFTVQE